MANNRNKSNPAGVIFALLMLVVIVVALVIVLRSCSGPAGEEQPSAPPADTAEPADPGAEDSAAPVSTPSAPPTPSATPAATPAPTPSPTPAPANASGTLRSDTGTSLNIVADWELRGGTLTVSVSAESYSLQSVGAWHAGSVTVGGQTYYFDTQAISYDGPGQGLNPLGSVTIQNVSAGSAIEVAWHFRGTYGGVELETISASGTLS